MTREDAKREIMFAKRNVVADSWIDQAYDVAIKALSEPEIIRCRECRWWDPCPSSTIAPLYHLCRRVGRMNMTADDFCSRPERWEVSE